MWNRVRLGLARWLRKLADKLDPPPANPTTGRPSGWHSGWRAPERNADRPEGGDKDTHWGRGDPLKPEDIEPFTRDRRPDV